MKTKLTLLLINLCLCAYSQHPHAIPEDDIYIKTIFNIQDYASGGNTHDIAFIAIEVKNDIDRNNYKIRYTNANGETHERYFRQNTAPSTPMNFVASTPPDYSVRENSSDLLPADTEIYIVNGISSKGYDILNGTGGYGYFMVHDILGGAITNKHFSRCWWANFHVDFNNAPNTKIELLYNANGTWTLFDVWEGPLSHNKYDQRNVNTANATFTASEWNRNQDSASDVGTLGTTTVEFNAVLFLSPNPVGDNFQIRNLKKQSSYKIFNSLGALIQKGEISEGEFIQTSNFNSGLYVLKLSSGHFFKFLKQ